MNDRYLFRGKLAQNCMQGKIGDWTYWEGLVGLLDTWRINLTTIGQCTGLKDKNGKLIFEGDIVVQDGYIWFDDGTPNYRGTVEWIYSQWQVVAHCINPEKRGISDGINEGLNDEGYEDGEISEWEIIGSFTR